MVWPFTSGRSQDDNSELYSKLDPSLRQFLDRESTNKYKPSAPPERPVPAREQANLTPDESTTPPPIPTLYPDGRYAHIWKNYRSRAAIESENRSEQEKLADVLRSYKDRRYDINKAALENCAAVNVECDRCYRKPSLTERATMCGEKTRALARCLEMNRQFLKALGYQNQQRSLEEDEAIQMHADRLYTNMLAKEKEMNEARAEGREIPEPTTSFDPPENPKELDELEELSPRLRQHLEKRTKGMAAAQKELEERAFVSEIRAGAEAVERLERYYAEVRQARLERIASGKANTFDGVLKWLGY